MDKNSLKNKMKKRNEKKLVETDLSFKKNSMEYFMLIAVSLIILSSSTISAFSNSEINSTLYSGNIDSGLASGNLTADSIEGSTAGFYQQAIGWLNDLLFTGIHGFSFNVSNPSGSLPTINLTKPENGTYIKRTNLQLMYTSTNALYVWYNLDGGSNTTLTENITFDITNGPHTLYIFANNTYGNANDNVTFFTNDTKFIIHYNNHFGSSKGSSTDFNESTYEELQNLSDITLENTNYGKIKFNTAINITNDSTNSDNELDIDDYISITNNSISINSTALPNFNKSATLYLYNLGFTNPRILRDNAECPSTICTKVSYGGGILVFNVTGFTNYSADETPATPAKGTDTTGITGRSSSGGSGGGTAATPTFNVDKNEISASLAQGQVKTEEIVITNTGDNAITINIENQIKDLVAVGEDTITLKTKESKAIPLYLMAKENTIPDLYIGKIILSSGNVKKEVLIIMQVESAGTLLDVKAQVLEEYKNIFPGKYTLAEISLFNLGGPVGRKDITIEYIIKDYEGNEILKETETVAVETQATFIKKILIPDYLKAGKYILYVKSTYDNKIASASANFEIISSNTTEMEKVYILTIIILSILLASIVSYILLRKDKKKRVGKINLRRIMK